MPDLIRYGIIFIMSKKYYIICGVMTVLVLVAGVFFAYQQGYIFKKEVVLTPEKLLIFEIKDKNLSAGEARIYQENFNKALVRLRADQEDFTGWLFLGILKKGVGDYEGARDVWRYAAQLRPKSSPPFANLADLYANFLNQPQKGLEMIKIAIANEPNDINFYLMMADIYRYRLPGQEAMYETTMLEALQKFPDNANLIGPLAGYFRDTNQTNKAIQWYKELVRLLPDNAAAKADLAELEAKQ